MYGAMRRCAASLPRTLSSTALSSRISRPAGLQLSSASRFTAPRASNVAIAAFHQTAKWRQTAAAYEQVDQPAGSDGPITHFKHLATKGLVHPTIIDTITRQMKLETMTEVQTRTINEALSGVDVIAQAKTGTGKTLGFLVPIVQRIIQNDPKLGEKTRGYNRALPDDIRAIILSPTRELAEQIAVEAKKITQGTKVITQIAVGGTQKRAMLQKTQREGCHLLIATPGRLYDILSDEYSGISAPKLSALVMDEADRLLDQGFQKEIEDILTLLPDPAQVDRQTLMFSATIPRDVVNLVRRTLKEGFHFAKCVDENEQPTHERIPQKVVNLAGFENIMPALYELAAREHQASKTGEKRPFKAIAYFNSTSEVTLAASVFYKLCRGFKRDGPLFGMTGYEIHSKLTQQQRTRASEDFRHAKAGILFSSDVTARGMDFPNVTHVIQIGLPRERDSYIHRIGRTGRAGKEGEGWLFLTPIEKHEARKRLHRLPLENEDSLETANVDLAEEAEIPAHVAQIVDEVKGIYQKVYPDQLENAFRGIFGSYQWYGDKQGLLNSVNRLAELGWGMSNPPPPPASLYGGGRGRPSGGRGGSAGGFGGDRRSGGGFGGEKRGGGGYSDRGQRGRAGGFGGRDQRSEGGDRRGGAGGFGGRPSGVDRFGGRGRQADIGGDF
ncbi:P-loop containing nucleoside triphosphate hydrolase protein [Lophiotrema nucula]|uniref:ATP-dependent RNA helicase n=1 Tax=Lophiotrema nucula TaxID=690887 RepID=A0A6A5YUF5_9PLEO|nr:P-loop containing nucleoside triphosphate hydrolase protein [Lophiotrema nucula]